MAGKILPIRVKLAENAKPARDLAAAIIAPFLSRMPNPYGWSRFCLALLMKSKSSAPPTRFLGLDFLRGFGAIGVVVGHSTMGALFMSTYLAVDFFLVLSGFVLTKAYFDKPSLDLPKFIWLRFARMYPLHFLTLMVMMILTLFAANEFYAWAFLKHGLLIHSVGIGPFYTIYNYPSWTISTEFWINVWVALAFVYLVKTRFLLFAIVCVVSMYLLFISIERLDITYQPIAFGLNGGLVRCTAGFLIGVGVYYIYKRWTWPIPLWAKLMAFSFFWFILIGPDFYGRYGVLVLPILGVVLFCFTDPNSKFDRILGRFKYLGDISYSIYLVHMPILKTAEWIGRDAFGIEDFFPIRTHPLFVICFVIVSVIVAHFTYKFYEAPLYKTMRTWPNRLKEWRTARSGSVSSEK